MQLVNRDLNRSSLHYNHTAILPAWVTRLSSFILMVLLDVPRHLIKTRNEAKITGRKLKPRGKRKLGLGDPAREHWDTL